MAAKALTVQNLSAREKEILAGTGKMDPVSSSIRMRAARKVSGLNQDQLANALGITKSTISGIERGVSFPSREMMAFYLKEYRIDFNFLISGLYSQLPQDVQEKLFPALIDAKNAMERKGS
ncbi:MAG: XRE family transcriptional regulator [Sphingomonadales bacterium]|nr:MAG: XRE family transcriptional regulator [Sphingomonadales bacterium]